MSAIVRSSVQLPCRFTAASFDFRCAMMAKLDNLAAVGHLPRSSALRPVWGSPDTADYPRWLGYDANDRPCVKTHTSAKCRKHNSPARHRTSRVQYDLTLRDAIARRYFYVWRDRWSFRTAKTPSRHGPDRNPALRQAPDLILANPLCCHSG